jgi:hypothetical protein
MCVSLIESEAYVFALFVLCCVYALLPPTYSTSILVSSLRMLPASQTLSWPQSERVSAFLRKYLVYFVNSCFK